MTSIVNTTNYISDACVCHTPVERSKALEGAVVEPENDAIVHGSGDIGHAERIHISLPDFGPGDGDSGVERRHRIRELVVEVPHLRVDLTFDEPVHVAQHRWFDRVEDVRSQ